jgi:hypothetical protein
MNLINFVQDELKTTLEDWDKFGEKEKRVKIDAFKKENEGKRFKKLSSVQQKGVTNLLGYDKDDWNFGKPKPLKVNEEQ